ncbi:MAG: TetR/AcrR family transcriptional regulator [Bacillota bacterium]
MENRENILNIALMLFSSKGYDSVGIQEIVDKAGVTKPTLYHYFGSKRGLLDSLLEEHFNHLYEAVKTAACYNGNLPETMSSVAKTVFEFAKSGKDFYRMYLTMCFASPGSEAFSAVYPYNEKLNLLLTDLFKAASKDHGNMRGRHTRYAFTFWGMLNNYITLFLGNFIELNEESAYQAVKQFSHGIYS